MWLEKYQPDWRQLLRPSCSTASALGTEEEGLVEMELADKSNISLRVEWEEPIKDSSVILVTDEGSPNDDEVNILKDVSQKMKLEVNAKNQELKGLRARKEKALKDLHSITSEITAVHKKAEKHREYLEKKPAGGGRRSAQVGGFRAGDTGEEVQKEGAVEGQGAEAGSDEASNSCHEPAKN